MIHSYSCLLLISLFSIRSSMSMILCWAGRKGKGKWRRVCCGCGLTCGVSVSFLVIVFVVFVRLLAVTIGGVW